MAQSFVVSPQSRGALSVRKIGRLTNEEAFQIFCMCRWGGLHPKSCPLCGVDRKPHYLKTRKQWRCSDKDCGRTFSVTSGTKFAYHKKPYEDILYAIGLFANGIEGVSASRNASNMGVGHKPVFVFQHKIREALFESRDLTPLSGDIEIDGCYFHYYVRPKNKRKNRVDRRLIANMNPNKRAVLVIRQRGAKDQGAVRTMVFVIKQENERDVWALVNKYVVPGSTIYADEHSCYVGLASRYNLKQVNHQEEYSADDGTNENQAESFFARNRKLFGHIHKCDPKYLLYYANEMAWREDNRRKSFTYQFNYLLKISLSTGQSRYWSKYWQGNHLIEDTLFRAG